MFAKFLSVEIKVELKQGTVRESGPRRVICGAFHYNIVGTVLVGAHYENALCIKFNRTSL